MPAEKILYGESLRSSMPKINAMIDVADKARIDSEQASKLSLSTSRQLSRLIIESGTSDAETIQARDSYPVLNDRFVAIDTQLSQIVSKNKLTVNIKDYGAKGDGVTNDTQAFLDCVAFLESLGGGTIWIPFGNYNIDGYIELTSNISFTAENGVILSKTLTATSAYMFTIGMTKGVAGYGGGGKNINFSNIAFKGYSVGTTYKSLALTFNHAQGVTFTGCRFVDCITNGHAVDLGGCNDIIFEGCSFEGSVNSLGREYTEAIQIDSSTPTSLSSDFTNYDGLPTKNVTVRNCKFIPSYNENGSVKNYAPNPIGNHGYTGGKYYEGIVFDNNLIYDGWESTGTSWRAWVHFYALKDSKFTNNRFINIRGVKCAPLGFYTSSDGRYDPVTFESSAGVPVVHKNIEISGNLFEGFSNVVGATSIIRAYGLNYNDVDYKITNIKISDNQFTNNGSSAMIEDEGPNLIQVNLYTNLIIQGNKADLGGRFASVYTGFNLAIEGNVFTRMSTGGIYNSTSDVVSVKGNIGENMRRPLEILESGNLSIKDNVFDGVKQTGVEDHVNRLRNLKGAIIQGNLTKNNGGATKGYYVYDTTGVSSDVKVYDNLAIGFTTDVFTSGTIVRYGYRA